MTARPRHRPLQQAFTLLEMSIVLLIMALLAGVCLFSFGSLSVEETLRTPAVALQGMSMEAFRRTGVFEEPQTVEFGERSFSTRFRQVSGPTASDPDSSSAWQKRVECPTGVRVLLRRFGSSTFQPAAGQQMVLVPGHLCEPLTARFELGASWLQITLDPLNGSIADEEMYIAPSS
ncbi:MAG: Tfp pilus assembly protein FimT/FimU [Verrucomicrobium sp.]